MGKWINIFKTGTHTDSAGNRRTWTKADLTRIAGNYAARTEDAPVVFGHPASSDPAQGWFEDVRVNGEFLQAQCAQVSDKARQGLDSGAYKYGSLSLTPDLRIRHFGLLGAVPPAVKGLSRVEFSEANGDISMTVDINFNEQEPEGTPPASQEDAMDWEQRAKELEAKLAASEQAARTAEDAKAKAETELQTRASEFSEAEAGRRKAELEARVALLVDGGKLLPADRGMVLSFCEALDGGQEMSFCEGDGKKPLVDHFIGFLGGGKGHGLLQEFSAPAAAGGADAPYEDLTKFV